MTQGGILSGAAIREAVMSGRIKIDPFRDEHVNAASYDITLGSQIRVYEKVTWIDGAGEWDSKEQLRVWPGSFGCLDAAKPNPTRLFTVGPGSAFRLVPGVGYLMHTEERISSECYVPVLDGKSSLGRLFISIHETAGYIDPHFDGQVTLEVTVTHPVRVYQGMRFGQIRFHSLMGDVVPYAGRYRGEEAMGAVASRAFEQIEESGLIK